MTTSLSEEMLVGVVALGLLPWIGWTMLRGLREERLPIGRGHVSRRERQGAFGVLLALYAAAALLIGAIAVDLLFGVKLWA